MGSPKTFQNKKIDRRSAAAEDFLRLVVDTIPALVVSENVGDGLGGELGELEASGTRASV